MADKVANYSYVVLSRVRTQKGLILQEPLHENIEKYNAIPANLTHMLTKFNGRSPEFYSDEDYSAISLGIFR